MDWLLQNWESVLAATLAAASIITRVTPTPKDDALLAKALHLLGRLSLLEHRDSEKTVKLPGKKTRELPLAQEMLD